MPYRIRSIRLQGIRGFNKPEEITIGDGVTLLYGENGSGKSSLLQGIEWAMTGTIPFMKGGDFAREDAIVNLFTRSKKASVELSLQKDEAYITLQRTRKMGTRTATGKQPLELKVGDQTLTEDEAEAELERILKISLPEFPQNKYLHQETLRDILQAKPEERTQAIDKLLGTYEVREFAKAMSIDRDIRSSITSLEERAEGLRKDKIQLLINLKRTLEATKRALILKGIKEDDLTLASAVKNLEHTKTRVGELGDYYKTKPMPSVQIQPLAQSLIEAQKAVLNYLNDLDRARLEAINRIQLHKASLQNSSTRYSETYIRFQGMRDAGSQNITARIEKIDRELAEIGSKIKEIRLKLNTLPHKRVIYYATKTTLEGKNEEKERLIKEFGTSEDIAKKIEQGEKELETILGELNKLSGQQRLITLAIQYLETSRAKECPVCSQSINYEVIIKDLKTRVSEEITKTIMHLQEDEKRIKSHRKALDEASETQKNLFKEISELKTSLSKASEELRKFVPYFEKLSLDEVSKGWEQEINGLSGKESELRAEQNGLRETLKQLVELKTTLERLEKELQKETSSQLTGNELTNKVEEKIKALDGEVTKYSDSEAVDTLRRNLSNLADVLTYLRDEDQVQTIEREMPTVEKQIQDLEARKNSLQSLAASLQTIRQIATQYEKEASLTQLRRLEDEINNYYNRIQGHPHFTRLKVDIEKEDPLIFSFRAASDQEDTYIPTRFSTAQLNAAALSIFMSNSSQQAGELPIMILDDPTQNMDTAHKEAFAKLVATLPPRHQVIVATEDDETHKFLVQYCKDSKTYELTSWTTEGPEIRAI